MRRRALCAMAIAALIGGAVAVLPVRAEDRPAAAAGVVVTPKVGDQIACAIDGMKMPLEADTPSLEHGGKTYYFCSDAEKRTFLKDPERYTKP